MPTPTPPPPAPAGQEPSADDPPATDESEPLPGRPALVRRRRRLALVAAVAAAVLLALDFGGLGWSPPVQSGRTALLPGLDLQGLGDYLPDWDGVPGTGGGH